MGKGRYRNRSVARGFIPRPEEPGVREWLLRNAAASLNLAKAAHEWTALQIRISSGRGEPRVRPVHGWAYKP